MGKASQLKRRKNKIIKTLESVEFQAHIEKTLMGMPSEYYLVLIDKLIQNAQKGVADKWVGMPIKPVEFRIGYESDGNCYTMFIDDNGVGHSYDFNKQNPSTPTPCIPYPAMKKTAFPIS